jgi:hypothetical protein
VIAATSVIKTIRSLLIPVGIDIWQANARGTIKITSVHRVEQKYAAPIGEPRRLPFLLLQK